MNKRDKILSALETLGRNRSAQEIVDYVREKTGTEVSKYYVYMLRGGKTTPAAEDARVPLPAVQTARRLLRVAGDEGVAMRALRQVCGENSQILDIAEYYLGQIATLEQEMSNLPENLRSFHKEEIRLLSNRLQGVRKLAA